MSENNLITLRCANHPDRETMLRCNRCDKPICYQCAVRTPVGQRCKECVRTQQNVYYNGGQFDLVIAGGIAVVLGGLLGAAGYAFLGIVGFYSLILAFFVGPAAGGVVAEAIRRCGAQAPDARHEVARRRAFPLGRVGGWGVVGGLPRALFPLGCAVGRRSGCEHALRPAAVKT